MAVNRRDGSAQFFSDVLGAVSLSHECEDFKFAIGKGVEGAQIDAIGDDDVQFVCTIDEHMKVRREDGFDDHIQDGGVFSIDLNLDRMDLRAESVAADEFEDDEGSLLFDDALEERDAFICPLFGSEFVEGRPDGVVQIEIVVV